MAKSAAIASMMVAIVLIGLKSWASMRTGSSAMLASLADSALDLVASLVTLIGVWIAAQPADENHRYGHGKAEALAAIVQVILIAISATGIAYYAIEHFLIGGHTRAVDEGIAVSLVAIGATLLLLLWQRHVIARTGSVAIGADHVHYQSDLLLNLAVIAALVLDQYAGISGADPLFGLAISAWLLWSAWKAGRDALDHLMDREWPDEKRRRFVELARQYPELSRLHDLRTRTSGNRDFVQFHVDLPGAMTVQNAHDIIERVEDGLMQHFPDMELLIHIDPQGHVDGPDNSLAEENEFGKLGDHKR